jgi:hypothetical protein
VGLGAARAIATPHDGTVDVENRPAGSAFVMRLPAAPAQ